LIYKYLQILLTVSISTKYQFLKVLKYKYMYISTEKVLKYVLKYFGT